MNEQFGEKVKAIFDSITVLQAKDSDLKRDNANINGDSPMGAMLQYGANTAKEYNLEYLIKPAIAELHRDGFIYTTLTSMRGRRPARRLSFESFSRTDSIPVTAI